MLRQHPHAPRHHFKGRALRRRCVVVLQHTRLGRADLLQQFDRHTVERRLKSGVDAAADLDLLLRRPAVHMLQDRQGRLRVTLAAGLRQLERVLQFGICATF